jgi:integrase
MLVLRKDSQFYHAAFYVGKERKWMSLNTADKADAVALHNEIQARLTSRKVKARVSRLLGEKIVKPRPMMIRDVAKKYIATNKNYSPSGLKIWFAFQEWLADDFGDISDIDTPKALEYLKSLDGAGKWYNNVKSALSKIWTVLKPYTDISVNPWKEISTEATDSEKFRSLSIDEVSRLFKQLEDSADWYDAAMISLWTALRKKSVFLLRVEDIKGGAIDKVLEKTRKAHGKAVYIPIHAEIRPIIEKRVKQALDGWLFPKLHKSYGAGSSNLRINKAFEDAKIKDASFHCLRTTFITRCDEQKIPRHITMGIVGHIKEETTEHYSEDRISARQILALK